VVTRWVWLSSVSLHISLWNIADLKIDNRYNALGEGWGNSLLGFVAIGFGLPVAIGLWNYRIN
jgi:hypothetical protein